tara:strand:- start:111 stop:848 length:738 start_codon:yes stop_codon:yes gene_type:complete
MSLREKKFTLGSWITLGHPSIAEVMCEAGFDWLCVDIEHSQINIDNLLNLIIAIQGKKMKAYVRVGSNDPSTIKRVLDSGADGIIIPQINTLDEAKRAIKNVRYSPMGERGLGLARAQGYGFNLENYLKGKARNIELIVQIEHYKGIKNLHQILSLEGLDGSFLGPYDLSASIGIPGKFDSKKFKDLVTEYNDVTSKFTKKKGFHVVSKNIEDVTQKKSEGYDFLAFNFDVFFMGLSIREFLKKI